MGHLNSEVKPSPKVIRLEKVDLFTLQYPGSWGDHEDENVAACYGDLILRLSLECYSSLQNVHAGRRNCARQSCQNLGIQEHSSSI